MILDEGPEIDPAEEAAARRTRLAALGVSLLVTGVLLAAVLALGDWAYRHRELTLHHGRLQRLVQAEPTVDDVDRALAAEGAAALPPPRLPALSDAEREQVESRRGRFAHMRVYAVGRLSYVLFFDDKGVLRDFVLASG